MKDCEYSIGQPLCFVSPIDCLVTVGELVEVIKDVSGCVYKIKEWSDDGWIFYKITEDKIVVMESSGKPKFDTWMVEHMTEVCQAFGRDVSDNVLLVYDSFDTLCDDFEDEDGTFKPYCRQVCDKWVILVG